MFVILEGLSCGVGGGFKGNFVEYCVVGGCGGVCGFCYVGGCEVVVVVVVVL